MQTAANKIPMVITMVQTFNPVLTDSKLIKPYWDIRTISLATISSSGSPGMKLSSWELS